MRMRTKLFDILICLFLLPSFFYLRAKSINKRAIDTPAVRKADTGRKIAGHVVSNEINAVYEQNLRTSFAGQEFFEPNTTFFVGDLSSIWFFSARRNCHSFFVGNLGRRPTAWRFFSSQLNVTVLI